MGLKKMAGGLKKKAPNFECFFCTLISSAFVWIGFFFLKHVTPLEGGPLKSQW